LKWSPGRTVLEYECEALGYISYQA
jgi:hypothetical protein